MTLDQLVEAVCASPQLRRSERSRAVLRFLAKHSGNSAETREARKAGLIDLNGGDEATVPTMVARTQAKVEEFFAGAESRHYSLAIEIVRSSPQNLRPLDLYALRLVRNQNTGTVTRMFWRPYFDPAVPTWLVYGEPLFMKTRRKDVYIRDVAINRREEVPDSRDAVYPFLRLGEVRCMLEIVRLFAEHKIPLHLLSCRRGHGLDQLMKGTGGGKSHVIVLGNTFSNGILHAYQSNRKFPFYMEGATILKRQGESKRIVGTFDDAAIPDIADCITTHALISRRRGFDPSTCVTTIASDNGRAIYRMGQVLCSDTELRNATRQGPLQHLDGNALPAEFQIVFKIWVHDHGDTPIHYEAVDWWPRVEE